MKSSEFTTSSSTIKYGMISYCINNLLPCINSINCIPFLINICYMYIFNIVQAYNPVVLTGTTDVNIVYTKLVIVSLTRPNLKLVTYPYHNVL